VRLWRVPFVWLLAPVITSTLDIAIGSVDVGAIDGFAAPTAALDVGASIDDVRVQLEGQHGLWTDEGKSRHNQMLADPTLALPASGTFSRIALGVRYYVMNLVYRAPAQPREGALRLYVESSVGFERITAPDFLVTRPDLALGFGMAQESPVFAHGLVGGHFGVRAVIAAPVENDVALRTVCRGCPVPPGVTSRLDVALFVTIGVVFGRS